MGDDSDNENTDKKEDEEIDSGDETDADDAASGSSGSDGDDSEEEESASSADGSIQGNIADTGVNTNNKDALLGVKDASKEDKDKEKRQFDLIQLLFVESLGSMNPKKLDNIETLCQDFNVMRGYRYNLQVFFDFFAPSKQYWSSKLIELAQLDVIARNWNQCMLYQLFDDIEWKLYTKHDKWIKKYEWMLKDDVTKIENEVKKFLETSKKINDTVEHNKPRLSTVRGNGLSAMGSVGLKTRIKRAAQSEKNT